MNLIDDYFDTKLKLFGVEIRFFDLLFALIIFLFGMMVRLSVYPIESGDYKGFLVKWLEECDRAGGIGYLGITPGINDESTINYAWMYQYVIILIHYLSSFTEGLFLIKHVSVIFDLVCSVTIMRITYIACDKNAKKAILSFALALLLPTVVINGAAWGQCDSIYTAFALLAILHLIKGNDARMFIYLGLSYSFKQQVIFLFPLLVIMWIKGKIKLKYIFWFPAVLFITMIPALLAGREFSELVGIYSDQVGEYSELTKNYPSIYTVVNQNLDVAMNNVIISMGTLLTISVLGILVYYLRDKIKEINSELTITIAIFTVELCLFMLPAMHERYGYMAEILSVVYAVINPKRLAVCAAMQFVSLVTYSRFLFGSMVHDMWPLTVMLIFVLCYVGYDLYMQLDKTGGEA